jgi:hypothetical protein
MTKQGTFGDTDTLLYMMQEQAEQVHDHLLTGSSEQLLQKVYRLCDDYRASGWKRPAGDVHRVIDAVQDVQRGGWTEPGHSEIAGQKLLPLYAALWLLWQQEQTREEQA